MLSSLLRRHTPLTLWRASTRSYAEDAQTSFSAKLSEKLKKILPAEEDPDKEKKPESRWGRLKRERRAAPPPKKRSDYVFDRKIKYDLSPALEHVRKSAWADFDESVELVFRLNVDPRKADHNLRGTLHLPHGTGRADRICVFVADERDDVAESARAAGAHLVGAEDLIERVKKEGGNCVKDFVACLCVPEMLPLIAQKIGRVLGPKGLMPNAKHGTVVTENVDQVVSLFLKGAVPYRIEKMGNLMMNVGKLTFTDSMLEDNINAAFKAIHDVKPTNVRKGYFRKAVICSSMGPSVVLNCDSMRKKMLIDQQLT